MKVHSPRDPYFTAVVERIFKKGEKFSAIQLLQLRFITAVVRSGKYKINDLPQTKFLDTIIVDMEKKKAIGMQESLMKKRDSENIEVISKTKKINLGERMNIDGLIKLNAVLSEYECENLEKRKDQEIYFEQLVHRLCDSKGNYELKQFYQLRFITAVIIETGKSKIDKIPLRKSPEKIISDWEGNKIIGLQEELMRERDQTNLNVICKLQKIKLTKPMDFDELSDLNYLLGSYEKPQEEGVPQDFDFAEVVNYLCRSKEDERYNLKQFYQLRFITSVVKKGRYKIDDLPQNKEFSDIIADWEEKDIIKEDEEEKMKAADKRKLGEIFETYLGKENRSKIQRKGSYKLRLDMMKEFNDLLNAYSEKWNRNIRKGEIEDVSINNITSVYQILYMWALDKECPLSQRDVGEYYEKMCYISNSLIEREWEKLQIEIESSIKLGMENKECGGNITINKIIFRELKQCREKIRQKCDAELGDKRSKIFIDIEKGRNDNTLTE